MRAKDLALLVYLCVHGPIGHARGRLAALLWGDSRESAARHSLTQALGRIGRIIPGALALSGQEVRWTGTLACDAVTLLRGTPRPAQVDEGFALYRGPFLEGFEAGRGAEDFGDWVHHRRTELRNAALKLLEHAGEAAADADEWTRVLRLGERAVSVDPGGESGRRLVMRALAASGERNQALRYYEAFAEWLAEEYGAAPDPETRALAEQLRAHGTDPPPPAQVRGDPAPAAPSRPPPPPAAPRPSSDPPPPARTADEADPRIGPSTPRGPGDGAPAGGSAATAEPGAPARVAPPTPPTARWNRRWGMALGALLVAAMALALGIRVLNRPAAPERVGHGETLRERGGTRVYLAFAETLYAYPDTATLQACTGVRTPAIREVDALPPWPRAQLPSVREHPWIGGTAPVVTDHPRVRPAYVPIGCILAGVPDPSTLDSIFGPGALDRMTEVPHSVLASMPQAFAARGHPVRPAGTLIRSPGGALRWITYHGGALAVADSAVLATWCRTPGEAVDVGLAEFRYYRPFGELHPATTECRRDDLQSLASHGASAPCPQHVP
jgi:DNA-binding SARP family transcriptional activator